MNYQFDFDYQTRLLKISFFGDLDDKKLIETTQKLREVIPQLRPEKALTDFTSVDSVNIAAGTVNSLAHTRPAFAPHVPQVIVAPQDYVFGMARMFQTIGGDQRPNMHVVRTLRDGYRWALRKTRSTSD